MLLISVICATSGGIVTLPAVAILALSVLVGRSIEYITCAPTDPISETVAPSPAMRRTLTCGSGVCSADFLVFIFLTVSWVFQRL